VSTLDLIIRGGLVVDGTGAAPTEADIAIHAGRIAKVASDRNMRKPALDRNYGLSCRF